MQVVVAISLDRALSTYARRGRFFSFAELTLDVPLPLLVHGNAKFELRVGTIDALIGGSSAPVSEEEALWTIYGGTVPEGNVRETDADGKGKGKAKAKKEEPKAKAKGKGKKKGKEAPEETKEPEPEKKKEPEPLKPAQAVWPSPAFSFFMAEETLDSLLNMSLTQSTLELPVSVARVSGADGSTVPELLEGTLDIAAMCQVGC